MPTLKLNIDNTISFQNVPDATSYKSARAREAEEIRDKLRKGLVPVRYNDYYMELGGKTYNGWDRDDVERLKQCL